MVWRGEGEGWWGCFVTITLMSLNLPTSFLLLCLEDASQVASTRARDMEILGYLYLSSSKNTKRRFAELAGIAPTGSLALSSPGWSAPTWGESDYRLGPSRMARGR